MANNRNEAKVTFKAETAQFKQEIQQANRELTELRAELRLNQAELQRDGQSIENLENKLENLQQQYNVNERILSNLNKELQKAKEIFGADSAEAQRLQTQITNLTTTQTRLETQINSTNNELDDLRRESLQASDGMEELGQASRQTENEVEEVGDGFDSLDDALGDFIHDGIEQCVEAFKELMTASDNALTKLQGQTGATNKVMQDYEKIMKNIYYDNWGGSFEEVGEAIGQVRQQMHNLSNDELEDVSRRMIILSDVFDMDIREATLAVNSAMKQFGISSTEAFNLVVQGAQKGLNANDDLLDTVNEYSVQFRTAGYSADEMMNMLANGAQTGSWSIDKLGDAVKEMNIRMKDDTVFEALEKNKDEIGLTTEQIQRMRDEYMQGGDSAKKANQEVLDSIFGIEDANFRYQMGVQALGTMWEDLGEETIRSLYNTEGGINKNKDAMNELENTMNSSLSATLGSIGRQIQANLIEPIGNVLLNVAKPVFSFINDNFDKLKGVIIALGTTFGILASYMAIQTTIGLVTKAMQLLNITMMANPVLAVVGAIAILVGALYQLYQSSEEFRNSVNSLWETLKPIVETIKSTVIDALTEIWQTLQSAWNEIVGVIDEVMQESNGLIEIVQVMGEIWGGFLVYQIRGAVEIIKVLITIITSVVEVLIYAISGVVDFCTSIVRFFKDAWQKIESDIEYVKQIFLNLGQFLSDLWTSISEFVTTTWNNIKDFIVGVVTTIYNFYVAEFNMIKNTITNTFNAIANTIRNVWNNITSVISSTLNNIKSNISNTINNIKSFFSNGFNACKSTVTSVFNSIVSGIRDKLNTAKSVVQSAVNAIKNFFNFNWSLPKIKLPHFSVSGSKNPLDWLDQGVPSIKVSWYAKGGIFTQPTILPTLNGFKGVGEAGQEAVLPIDKLQDYMYNTMVNVLGNSLQTIIGQLSNIEQKDTNLYVDSQKLSDSLGQSNDYVSSSRFNLNNRGLSI